MKSLICIATGLVWVASVGVVYAAPPPGNNPEAQGEHVFVTQEDMDTGFGNATVNITMVLVSSAAEKSVREFSFHALEVAADGDKTLINFEQPARIKGTRLLSHEHRTTNDDQWLYLPALKRVKRVAAADKSGSFVGSEFAYEDLTYDYPNKYTHRYIREEKLGDIKVWVVERIPKDRNSGYKKILSYVDQSNYQTIKQKFLDRAERPLKIQILKGYRRYHGKHWRPSQIVMKNVQTNRQTVLKMTGWKFQQAVAAASFTKHNLAR